MTRVNEIDIPDDLETVPEINAYLRGFEDAERQIVKGGQGRSAESVAGDGNACGWFMLAACVFVGVCIAVSLFTRHG